MKGLIKKTAAAALAVTLGAASVGAAYAFGGVTEADTPTDKNDAALYWALKPGTGWTDAPSAPLVQGDRVYFTYGSKLAALDKQSGEMLEQYGELAGSVGYNACSPIYADGMVIVSLTGMVQAFDAETLQSLWVYTDKLGGQGISELTYADGYVYTGFWNGEAREANFVCIPTEDTDPQSGNEAQQAAWSYSHMGGFYWAGAYSTEEYLIVPTDDGESGSAGESSVIVFDKEQSIAENQPVVSSAMSEFEGDLRSAVSYEEESGYYYVSSKAGKLYRFTMSGGVVDNVEELKLPAATTSTPVIANGRLYVGCAGSGFTAYSGSCIAVVDTESFEIAYTLATNGYPQSSALVSSREGDNYVYFTANMSPGYIYAFHDNKDMTAPEKTETVTENGKTYEGCCPVLFTPRGEQANYCIASLCADEEGTLYFKNDSGYLMAVGSRIDSISAAGKTVYKEGDIVSAEDFTVTAELANGLTRDVTDYAEYTATALTLEDDEISFSYNGMLYGDTDEQAGYEYSELYCTLPITVLAEADYTALSDCIAAIDAIGEVTAESGEVISAARELYNSLSGDMQALVDNLDTLEAAEAEFAALTADSSQDSSENSSQDSSESGESSGDTSSEDSADTSSDTSSVDDSADSADTSVGTSSGQSSSAASSAASSAGTKTDSTANPATGGAAAASLTLVLLGATVTVYKKNR